MVVDPTGAKRGAEQVERRLNRVGDSADRMRRLIRRAFAFIGVFAAIRAITGLVDSFTSLQNKLRTVVPKQEQLNGAIDRLADIAFRTRAPLGAIVALFQRGSIAADELGASQADLLLFVERVGKALAIQGAPIGTARGALLQLSQTLGATIVRAEEFNSILEGAFPIAQATARGLDRASGSVARLRQLIIDGKVSSEEFFRAFLKGSKELEPVFERTRSTIGQALQVLRDRLSLFVGRLDEAEGASKLFSESVRSLAKNLDGVARVLGAVAAGFAAAFAAAILGKIVATTAAVLRLSVALSVRLVGALGLATRAMFLMLSPLNLIRTALFLLLNPITLLRKAFVLLSATLLVNPLFLVAAAVGAVVGAFVLLRNEFVKVNGEVTTLGDLVQTTFGTLFTFIKNTTAVLVKTFVPALGDADLSAANLAQTLTTGFLGFLTFLAKTIATLTQLGRFFGLIAKGIGIAFELVIVDILDAFESMFNFVLRNIKRFSFGRIDLGQVMLVTDKFRDDLLKAEVKLFKDLAEVTNPQFRKDIEDGILDGVEGAVDRAVALTRKRLIEQDIDKLIAKPGGFGEEEAKAKRNLPDPRFEEILRLARKETELLVLSNRERQIQEGLLKAEKTLKRVLKDEERELLDAVLRQNQSLADQAAILDDIRGPMEKYQAGLAAVRALLDRTAISSEEATLRTRELRIALLDTQRDAGAGLERAFLKMEERISNTGQFVEDTFNNAFEAAGDALNEFVRTGTVSLDTLNNFMQQLSQTLLKLALQQAATGIGNLGQGKGADIGGASGAGIGGIVTGLFKNLFGDGGSPAGDLAAGLIPLARGGSFTVGSGSSLATLPNSGVDNRLVAFRAQDGENVTVTPRGQNPRGDTVVINQNITTPGDPAAFVRSNNQIANRAAAATQRARARR